MVELMKKILRFIVTGSFTLFMAACYGMPADFRWNVNEIFVRNRNNAPIPGLKVTVIDGFVEKVLAVTDENGFTVYESQDLSEEASILVEDVDGAANLGDFQSQTHALSFNTEAHLIMEEK